MDNLLHLYILPAAVDIAIAGSLIMLVVFVALKLGERK